jgi:hypothetical protein
MRTLSLAVAGVAALVIAAGAAGFALGAAWRDNVARVPGR